MVLLLIGFMVLVCTAFWLWRHHLQKISVRFLPNAHGAEEVVLLLCMDPHSGGLERCVLAQHHEFIKAGVCSILVTPHNAFILPVALRAQLPVVTYHPTLVSSDAWVWCPGLRAALDFLIKQYGQRLLVVHSNSPRETFVARDALRGLDVPLVFSRHSVGYIRPSLRSTPDALIAVSPAIAEELEAANKRDGIKQQVAVLPPFFDTDRIESFEPTQDRATFFKQTFGVTLKTCPLLVKVAHLYADLAHKNHPLVLEAMHELIYRRNIPVQIALAGAGPSEALLRRLVREKGLDGYVHFLGATEQTPAVFHYADVALLAGRKEAFGMALAEGGLMKKPTIIADTAGAAGWLIEDGVTGYLFRADEASSLADRIAFILQHPTEATACGARLRDRVLNDFGPATTARRMMVFYRQLHDSVKTIA